MITNPSVIQLKRVQQYKKQRNKQKRKKERKKESGINNQRYIII
jgi:hypothetical protein